MQRKFIDVQVATLGLVLAGCEVGGEDEPGERAAAMAEAEAENETENEAESEKNAPKEKHCKVIDAWEPNPSADQPSLMTWEHSVSDLVWSDDVQAYLCAGEDDWYFFETASFDFANPTFSVWALIKDAGLCGAECGDEVIPVGPMHAMTVEVYRADTMELLISRTDDDGTILFEVSSAAYSHDVLIHVFSPNPWAKYPYRLANVSYSDGSGGDVCEC